MLRKTPAILSSDTGTDVSPSHQQHLENKLFCSICPFPLPFIEYVAFRLYRPLGEILFYSTVFILQRAHQGTHESAGQPVSTHKEVHIQACSMRPFFRGTSASRYPVSVCPWGLVSWGLEVSCSIEVEMLVMTQYFRSVSFVAGRLIILETVRLAFFFLND